MNGIDSATNGTRGNPATASSKVSSVGNHDSAVVQTCALVVGCVGVASLGADRGRAAAGVSGRAGYC